MLEQPPERSSLEIAAEAAVAAQISTHRRPHGCFRLIIWCMPTFFFYASLIAVVYATNALFRGRNESLTTAVFFILMLGLTYGVGFFDGYFSVNSIVSSPEQRQREILWHAAKFTAWQVLLIPAISVLIFGACMAVVTY